MVNATCFTQCSPSPVNVPGHFPAKLSPLHRTVQVSLDEFVGDPTHNGCVAVDAERVTNFVTT